MALHLTYQEMILRILATFVGMALIGMDRGEHGHNVGIRTTLLVGIAACLSMLQANALLDLSGKTADSFVGIDIMRLPLGILSGIGFIGAGAILRKGSLVSGVTTAATLWIVTVIGLCFGGGQMVLGWIGIAMGLIILVALRNVERRLPREVKGLLIVQINKGGPSEEMIREKILMTSMKIDSTQMKYFPIDQASHFEWSLRWTANPDKSKVPAVIHSISALPGLSVVEWQPLN